MKRNPGFDLLWGVEKRAKRGPKPECSVDSVVQAAAEVADAEGLTALTMSRVAEKLSVTTMALYRYVPGKAQLVDLMTDRVLGPPPTATGGWRQALEGWARTELARFRSHRWLLESVMARASLGPNWVGWLNAGLEVLAGRRMTARQKMAVLLAVDGLVRSAVEVETAPPGFSAAFARVLKIAKKDERFRALDEVATSGGFDAPEPGEDDTFEFGLQRLLDGIEKFERLRR